MAKSKPVNDIPVPALPAEAVLIDHTVLVDDPARILIRTALDTSIFVEAGAGSGKTHALVDRIIGLIADGANDGRQIVAVTFTRKAAIELRERLQLQLEKSLRQKELLSYHPQFAAALADTDRVFVGTIHQFCAKLLRARPIEAMLDPSFEEVEDDASAGLALEAWHEFLAKEHAEGSDRLGKLELVGLSTEDLRDAYLTLVTYPDVEFPLPDLAEPNYNLTLSAIRDFVTRALPFITSTSDVQKSKKLQDKVLATKRRFSRLDHFPPISLRDAFEVITQWLDVDDPTQKLWSKKEVAKAFAAEYESSLNPKIQSAMSEWYAYRYPIAIGFAGKAADYYADMRRRRAVLNYADLLEKVAVMLRTQPEVRQYFANKFRQILVDEFQDTDPIQAEILLWLTGKEDADVGTMNERASWQQRVPRPGSLFVVGDPKQSIYRFRRADIQTFNLVRDIIVKGDGEDAELLTTFRASAKLTKPLNAALSPLFARSEPPYQAVYNKLEAKADNPGYSTSGLRVLVSGSKIDKVADKVAADTGRIADAIEWAVAGNVRTSEKDVGRGITHSEIMVLLPQKADLDTYCAVLEERGIPYEVKGAKSFSNSPELQELLVLLQLLDDPANQIQLFRVLRGSFFGISDKAVYDFVEGGGTLYLNNPSASAPSDSDAGQASTQIIHALDKLARWRKYFETMPLAGAFEQIVQELGLAAFALSGQSGGSAAGNILKAIEVVRASNLTTLHALATRLKEMLVSKVEEHAIPRAGGGAVQVMNLHQAKGLEAKLVFLARPLDAKDHPPTYHIERESDHSQGYILVRRPNGPYHWTTLAHHPDWDSFGAEEERYDDAEKMRLQYVAATRAAELLVVSVARIEGKAPTAGYWNPLVPNLAEIDELVVPFATPLAEPGSDIDGNEWTAERTRAVRIASDAIARSTEPTYGQLAAKEYALAGHLHPYATDANGYGIAFGTVVHKILERSPLPEPLEPFVRMLLTEEGLDHSLTNEVVSAVKRVTDSDLWLRAGKAARVLREVPFIVPAPSDGAAHAAVPCVLTGAIDLMFLEADGWVIVDYKTDAGAIDPLVEHYKPQLDLYANVWSSYTKEPVKEKWLLFTTSGEGRKV